MNTLAGVKRIVTLGLLIGATLPVTAGEGAGTATGHFLKMGVGARGLGMGEAQTASINDVMSLYWNPAGLGGMDRKEVGFMHNKAFLGVSQEVLYYAQPAGRLGTLGLGMSYLRVRDIAGYDPQGVATAEVAASDTLVSVGWGKKWSLLRWPGLETGANLKFLRKELGDVTGSGVMADVGGKYRIGQGWLKGVETGVVVQNIGSGIQFEQEKSPLPRMLKGGLAYGFFGGSVLVAGDYVMNEGRSGINVGVDYRIWEAMSFRLGHRGGKGLGNGVSYGVGFGQGDWKMDYAFAGYGDVGEGHRVSVGYKFGKKRGVESVEGQVGRLYGEAERLYAGGYLMEAYGQAGLVSQAAPWHNNARVLMHKISTELKVLEGATQEGELYIKIENHMERGVKLYDKDELVDARKEFEAILSLVPQHAGAEGYLKRIEERFRNMAVNFFNQGMKQFDAGEYAAAKESFRKVLVMDPQHPEATGYVDKIQALLNQMDEEKRQQQLREVLNSTLESARTAVEERKYDEGLRLLEEILNRFPSHEEAVALRTQTWGQLAKQKFQEGMRAMQTGEWKEAVIHLQGALKLKPDYDEARKVLSDLLARQGEQSKTESLQLYKQGLEALVEGDKAKARGFWEKALAIWPENLDARRGVERLSRPSNGE